MANKKNITKEFLESMFLTTGLLQNQIQRKKRKECL